MHVLPSALPPPLSELLEFGTRSSIGHSPTADLTVDCSLGSDEADGSYQRPLRSIAAAIRRAHTVGREVANPTVIDIAEGTCHLEEPLKLGGREAAPIHLRGRGVSSVLSGGKPIDGWASTPWDNAPPGAVYVAEVRDWPVEIKSLRAGSHAIPRSRWPRRVAEGLRSTNWMFAMNWSAHPSSAAISSGGRHLHHLGLNASELPANASLAELVGAYANVLGCVESDVNSQLTKVLAVNSTNASRPTVAVLFRNSFNVGQRFYLENVRWALAPGEFYHDARAGKLFYWPANGTLPAAGSVVAPVLDTLIALDHAHGHVVSHLTLTDTTYYADGYWDGPAKQPSDAAIRINYCTGVRVTACNFLGSRV